MVQCAAFDEPPLRITGDATRYDHRDGNDDYTQAGNLFRLMNPEQIGVALALGIDLAEFVPNGAYNSKP